MKVKENYIKDAHNNVKNYFDTDIPKPAKRQSDCHVCFLKRQEI